MRQSASWISIERRTAANVSPLLPSPWAAGCKKQPTQRPCASRAIEPQRAQPDETAAIVAESLKPERFIEEIRNSNSFGQADPPGYRRGNALLRQSIRPHPAYRRLL